MLYPPSLFLHTDICKPLLENPQLFDSPAPLLRDSIAVRLVPDDDPREDLRGQHGVFAIRAIPAWTIIGQYCGQLSLGSEIHYGRNNLRKLGKLSYMLQIENAFDDLLADDDAVKIDCYPDPSTRSGRFPNPPKGNECMFINDARGCPNPSRAENVMFLEILRKGWPHIFVVSMQAISPGSELKISYGKNYWKDQETIMTFCSLRV